MTRARAIDDNLKFKNRRDGEKEVHIVWFVCRMKNVRNSRFMSAAITGAMVLKVTCQSKSPETAGGLLELNKDKQY